jgi:hypothetical protein
MKNGHSQNKGDRGVLLYLIMKMRSNSQIFCQPVRQSYFLLFITNVTAILYCLFQKFLQKPIFTSSRFDYIFL